MLFCKCKGQPLLSNLYRRRVTWPTLIFAGFIIACNISHPKFQFSVVSLAPVHWIWIVRFKD